MAFNERVQQISEKYDLLDERLKNAGVKFDAGLTTGEEKRAPHGQQVRQQDQAAQQQEVEQQPEIEEETPLENDPQAEGGFEGVTMNLNKAFEPGGETGIEEVSQALDDLDDTKFGNFMATVGKYLTNRQAKLKQQIQNPNDLNIQNTGAPQQVGGQADVQQV